MPVQMNGRQSTFIINKEHNADYILCTPRTIVMYGAWLTWKFSNRQSWSGL